MGKQDFSTFLPYIILKSFPTFRVWAIFLHMSLVLTLLAPGFWVLVIPRGGAQSAHTQFKGSKLLFDLETLCVLSEIYIDFTRKKKLV